ncbi:MAG: YciI family protein [Gammaproteobacteria bacterium]|nr:YciI family protein [Gammaproteobacteria bacterium]
MLYVLICDDKADSEGLRKATRDQHLQYIQAFDVRFAGPMLSADESTMVGSIIVLNADDRTAAQAFADADPYALAGLFANVRIQPFRQVAPS